MKATFLGTAGSFPTPKRGAPAIAIQIGPQLILLDCGEGTQRQMAMARIGLKTKTRILITHMHGDHVLGLPGILQTMSLFSRVAPLRIYGPEGIAAFVEATRETVKFNPTYPIEVVEIGEGIVCEEKEYFVESAFMKHSIPALGYSIIERNKPGRFYPQKAIESGIPEGPLWGELQKGKTVESPEGRTVTPTDVMGPQRAGRKIVYTGDTSPNDAVVRLARDADLLIHEATFDDDSEYKALESGHSTPSQAAEIARDAHVKKLILTHVGGRYNKPDSFVNRARDIFSETMMAEDLMTFEVYVPRL
jgi:ribonuclease Z